MVKSAVFRRGTIFGALLLSGFLFASGAGRADSIARAPKFESGLNGGTGPAATAKRNRKVRETWARPGAPGLTTNGKGDSKTRVLNPSGK